MEEWEDDDIRLIIIFDANSTYKGEGYTVYDDWSETNFEMSHTKNISDTAKVSTFFFEKD